MHTAKLLVRQRELGYGYSPLMKNEDRSPIKNWEERVTNLKGADLIISFCKDLFSFIIKSSLLITADSKYIQATQPLSEKEMVKDRAAHSLQDDTWCDI